MGRLDRALSILALCTSGAAAAEPIVGAVSVAPTFVRPATAAQVKLTVGIPEPALIPGGANVQRLNSSARLFQFWAYSMTTVRMATSWRAIESILSYSR